MPSFGNRPLPPTRPWDPRCPCPPQPAPTWHSRLHDGDKAVGDTGVPQALAMSPSGSRLHCSPQLDQTTPSRAAKPTGTGKVRQLIYAGKINGHHNAPVITPSALLQCRWQLI